MFAAYDGRIDRWRSHAHPPRSPRAPGLAGPRCRCRGRRGCPGPGRAPACAQERRTRRYQARGHSTRPALDIPAQAPAAGPEAPGGDCPSPTPRRVWSHAAGAGGPVHDGRARGAADRRRRGAPARAVRRCIDALAARAGVCRSMAKNAIRTAASLGLLTVEERRREGQRNLPNVVRVVSREWLAWLAKTIGVRKFTPTGRESKTRPSCASEPVSLPEGGWQGGPRFTEILTALHRPGRPRGYRLLR